MMNRFVVIALIAGVFQCALAEEFPVRPVRIIVANPPGGTADLIGRLLAKKLGEMWQQSVVVDNRGGGSGAIGTDLVAKATPNGYTLLVSAPGAITTNTILFGKLTYDPVKDLAPIMLIGSTPSLLMVALNVPAKSVSELIALAKAKPGKLNYASSGLGNPSHLHGAMFAKAAGIDIVHVPYKGGGIALIDLLAGHVEMFFNPAPAMLTFIQSNKARALAVTSSQRLAALPSVPTMAECGFPNIGAAAWYGVLAPAKISPALLKKIHADLVKALADPVVKESLESGGTELVVSSPEKFAEFMRKETEQARELLKTSGAKRE
jgi:tripartite-type tricarboxylate transporter receptor subunit TctC